MRKPVIFALALGSALVAVVLGRAVSERSPRHTADGGFRPDTDRGAVEHALAAGDIAAAQQAWHRMYLTALDGHDWRDLVDAADAHRTIVRHAGLRASEPDPRAQELYLAALFRARAQGSLDGAVKVAERLAALGDRDTAGMALRLAATMPPHVAVPAADAGPQTSH